MRANIAIYNNSELRYCKKKTRGTLPSPPLLLPCCDASPEKQAQLGPVGSAVSSHSGVRGKAPEANAFGSILSSKIAHGGNIFGYLSYV